MKHFFVTVSFLLFVSFMGLNSSAWAHTDVTPQEAKNMIDTNEDLIVVDVREKESEYCDKDPTPPMPPGHIPGALNYPWNSGIFQERYQELPQDGEILLVCRSGNRSNQAAEFLDAKSYLNIYDMEGGMLAWEWETETCSPSCPSEILLHSDKDSLKALRQVRDTILMKSNLGMVMTALYYLYAKEISSLLLINSDLREKSIKIVNLLMPAMKSTLHGKNTLIKKETLHLLGDLLEMFADQASPSLKTIIRQITQGIKSGGLLNQLGIAVSK